MTAATAQRSADTFDLTVARGLRAWTEEQQSVTASRERWKHIGEALKVGRDLNKSNQDFGLWCTEHGFGDIDNRVRSDAVWLAGNPSVFHAVEDALAHPTHVRAAHRKLTAPAPKPRKAPEAPPAAPPPWAQASTAPMDKRAAEKAAKTLQRAEYGGEGADTAKRMFDSMARTAGVSPEQFAAEVKAGAPDTYHPFTPRAQAMIDRWRPGALADLRSLKTFGLSKEALRDLVLNLVNSV